MTAKRGLVASARSVRFPVAQFFVFFLPVAIVLVATSLWYVSIRMDAKLADIIKHERTQLNHVIGFIGAEVANSLNHVRSLAQESVTKKAMESANGSDVQDLEYSFLMLATRNPLYQQVRWIDETGMERIRVGRDQGAPYLVPSQGLQDKRDRYYFAEASALEVGELYISRLDLNVEHGEIETPPRPMLRVATPVTGADGRRRGILVINIALKYLFGFVQSVEQASMNADYLVLNHEGYRLSGTPQGERISYGLFRDVNFARSYPDTWERITAAPLGDLESSDGLWIWQTLSAEETVRKIATALSPDETIEPSLYFDNFSLKLVSHQPPATLVTMRGEARFPVMVGVAILLLVYGVSLYLYLRSSVVERQSELTVATAMAHAENVQHLRELEERFRRLFEASSTGLVVVDEEGSIELSNQAAASMFGYAKGELNGRLVDDLLPVDKRDQHAILRKGFMQAPTTRKMGEGRELEAVRKDGRKIPVEVGLNPYTDKGRALVLASIVDLSGRKLESEDDS